MSAPQQSLLSGIRPLPSRRERACCPACKQRLPRANAHILNEVLISGIWKLLKAGGGPCRLNELQLTNSEHGNSNQWAYFSLAFRDGGKWLLTDTARRFLNGEISLPRKVWTVRKGDRIEVVDREGSVTIKDVSREIWERGDYARESRTA